MAKISNGAIAKAAQLAGFRGDKLVTAVAVALAESGGDKDVYNGICCHGLWQIHTVHAKRYPLLWADKYNPLFNARMAFSISSGGSNWQPWEAYTNGNYREHLPAARKAAGNPTGGDQLGDTWEDPLGNLNPMTELVASIKKSGTRMAAFGGGILLATAGAILVVSDVARK